MSKGIKVEGIKEDIDVLGIVKSFEAFRDVLQLASDSAESMEVALEFESTHGKLSYTFHQDDQIILSGVSIDSKNKLVFAALDGAKEKHFHFDEAELIVVTKTTGEREDLRAIVQGIFANAFSDFKITSLVAFQAMLKNNPGLPNILNDPQPFLESYDKSAKRAKGYKTLEKFGRY